MSYIKINELSERQIDDKMKISLTLDDKFTYCDNYNIFRTEYDSSHGRSIYSDENKRGELPYDTDDSESLKELKTKLIEKMKTFY